MFDKCGYETLPGVIDRSLVATLLERLQYYETHADTYATQLEFRYGSGRERKVQKMRRLAWVDPEPWSQLWNVPGIRTFLQQRYSEPVRIARCAAFLKPAHDGDAIPYHQDQALWPQQFPGAISCWFALDATDEENGCLILSPRSSHLGPLPHDEPPGGGHPEVRASILEQLPREPIPLASGSAVAWDRYTVHGSAANRSNRSRRGVVIVFAPGHLLSPADPLAWNANS